MMAVLMIRFLVWDGDAYDLFKVLSLWERFYVIHLCWQLQL